MIRSPYTPSSIYLKGTIGSLWGLGLRARSLGLTGKFRVQSSRLRDVKGLWGYLHVPR